MRPGKGFWNSSQRKLYLVKWVCYLETKLPFWELCFGNVSNFGVTLSKIRVKMESFNLILWWFWKAGLRLSTGCAVSGPGQKPLKGKKSILLRQGVPLCVLSLAVSSEDKRGHIQLIHQPRGIIHTEKDSNEVAQMFWSLHTVNNCLEMWLQFLDLALGLSCESSQNSKSQFPKSCLQLDSRILKNSAIATEFAREKVTTRF